MSSDEENDARSLVLVLQPSYVSSSATFSKDGAGNEDAEHFYHFLGSKRQQNSREQGERLSMLA